MVAINGDVATSVPAVLDAGGNSFRVEKQAVQEFQCQHFVNFPGVISIPVQVTSHHCFQASRFNVRAR